MGVTNTSTASLHRGWVDPAEAQIKCKVWPIPQFPSVEQQEKAALPIMVVFPVAQSGSQLGIELNTKAMQHNPLTIAFKAVGNSAIITDA